MQKHIVKQGETVFSLSKLYRIPVDKIWDHPDNQGLKDKKRTQGILYTGDELTIPQIIKKEIDLRTNRTVRITLCLNKKCNLNIRFYRNGKARVSESYVLKINEEELNGFLDADGRLNVKIPSDLKETTIIFGEGDNQENVVLKIGYLDPISEITGVKQRLINLGLYFGDNDPEFNQSACVALKLFQKINGLRETGEVDSNTENKLKEIYGS